MTVADDIRAKLEAALAPSTLDIVDESASHAGHAGARPGGQSHFRLTIVAPGFAGKSRLERQRMINKILEQELAGPVHALAITAMSETESDR